VTRREHFLAEMDAVVPWGRLLALIAPYYPKAGPKGGRPPMPMPAPVPTPIPQSFAVAPLSVEE
jgi:hypothetical protein